MDKNAKAIVVIDTDPIISNGSVCLTADGSCKGMGSNQGCICTGTSARVDVWFFSCTIFNTASSAGIEPRTVATTALAVRRSNHSARSHPLYC
jgi:hypothetical protein